MKFALAVMALTFASLAVPASSPAEANPGFPNAAFPGLYKCKKRPTCEMAQQVHRAARYKVNHIRPCVVGPCPGGVQGGHFYYHYWR